jgi:hypothetical protein
MLIDWFIGHCPRVSSRSFAYAVFLSVKAVELLALARSRPWDYSAQVEVSESLARVCYTRRPFFGVANVRSFRVLRLSVLQAQTAFDIAEAIQDSARIYSPEGNDSFLPVTGDGPLRDAEMPSDFCSCYRPLDAVEDRRNERDRLG